VSRYAKVNDFDARFPDGAPSLRDAQSLTVRGDWTFGAGVIVRAEHHFRVRGLTSAACTWFAACVGIACGVGQWRIVAVALAIAFLLLTVGRRLERWLHGMFGGRNAPEPKSPAPVSSADTPAPDRF